VIVAAMGTIGALSMALGTLNFGLFVRPMGDDLGFGRSVFGWAQSARQAGSAVTAPVVGTLIDRFGARLLLVGAAVVTGLALIGLGFSTEAWQLVALFTVMGLVSMSGPGALVTSVPVTKWFVRNRGRALAFASIGTPLGGLVFVPLTQVLIDQFGWRWAWIILAIIGAGSIVPLALLFVRRQPEDLGLLPDGGAGRPRAAPSANASQRRREGSRPDERSWTRQEARRSGTFWRLVFVFSMVQLATNSVGVHRIPDFTDRGFDPRLIALATALDAGCAGLSSFSSGLLVQRFPPRLIGAGGFLLLALASGLTILASSTPAMFLAMMTFGLGIGVGLLLQSFIWADYFGRQHLGSIRGAVTPITLLVGGIGAPLSGYVRDLTGSYLAVWQAAIGMMLLGALILGTTRPPRPPPDRPGATSASPSR
jgi:sugar phosphate permease